MANTTGKKHAGRVAGVPNKDKTEVRALFQKIVEGNLETLQADMDSLKPVDRVKYTL